MTQQPQPTQNNTEIRLPTIIDHIINGQTHEQIAQLMNCSRTTIEHDLSTLQDSPTWKAYLYSRFVESDNKLRNSSDPNDYREAHRGVVKLLQRAGVQVNIQQNNMTMIRLVAKPQEQVEQSLP